MDEDGGEGQEIPHQVKTYRDEPLNERADNLVDEGRALTKNGKDYQWKDRTTHLVRCREEWENDSQGFMKVCSKETRRIYEGV